MASANRPIPETPPRSAKSLAARNFGPIDPFGISSARFIRRQPVKRRGSIRTRILVDRIDIGQQQQGIRTDISSQKRAGGILVDHRSNPDQTAIRFAQHRNAATTCTNHDHALIKQQSQDAQIRNFQGLRRRHDTPPKVSVLRNWSGKTNGIIME